MAPSSRSPVPNRHRRTRNDHTLETAEDYVEAILSLEQEQGSCRVKDLATRFEVTHVTVTKTITRLKRDGLVDGEPYGPLRLTPLGTRLAQQARERHETVLAFLIAIGVPKRIAEIDAEGIEHHVSPETLRRFAALTQRRRRATE